MKVSTVNELGYTELTIEEEEIYQENYQMVMLRECKIPGLLSVIGCGIDENSQYIYDISGLQSMAKLYEKTPLDECDIRGFAKALLGVLEEVKHHMLDINHILLEPEYIYRDDEMFYFCYYPLGKVPIKDSFHQLTQYFVQHIDYGEVDTVILTCGLHKATMEEEYDLTQLLEHESILDKGKSTIHEAKEARTLNKEALWENLESTQIKEVPSITHKSLPVPDCLPDSLEDKWMETKEEDATKKEFSYGPIKANKVLSKVADASIGKWWNKEKSSPDQMESSDRAAQKKKDVWGDWDALLKQEGYR